MTKIELEIFDDVVTAVNKIKGVNDSGVEIIVPEGSVLFENFLNIKLLKYEASLSGITVHFSTTDSVGQSLILMAEENIDPSTLTEGTEETPNESVEYKQNGRKRTFRNPLPKINMEKLFSPLKFVLKLPNFFWRKKIIFVVLMLFGSIALLLFSRKWSVKANIKLVVDAQPLTRSVTIKVKSESPTDSSKKILAGEILQALVDDSGSVPTTGIKLIGEKATGEIKIFNNTDSEKEFKEGTVLKNEDDLEYLTSDDIVVPARIQLEPDPEQPDIVSYKKGEATVSVSAKNIGEDYNLDKGEPLDFDDYNSNSYNAKVEKDIDGGMKKEVKVVSDEDISLLSANLLETNTERAKDSLKGKPEKSQKIVSGSEKITSQSEVFSHKLGDETDELTLNQVVLAEALAYSENDLNKLLDELMKEFIPPEHELSETDREVSVEILGNSTDSVLNLNEADIQVTLRTYVVSKIDSDELKNRLKGTTTAEAQKIIGSIKNVSSYEVYVNPKIPFFERIPKDISKIDLEITKKQ